MTLSILTPDELVQLTGYKQKRKQRVTLELWGVKFRQRLDGSIIASWNDVLEHRYPSPAQDKQPDFTAIR